VGLFLFCAFLCRLFFGRQAAYVWDMSDTAIIEIDATGHRCPLPVLKLMKALEGVAPGASLCLLTTDPASLRDVPGYCRDAGHGCMVDRADSAPYRFTIIKGQG